MKMGVLLSGVALVLGNASLANPQPIQPDRECTKRDTAGNVECTEHPEWYCFDPNAEEPLIYWKCDVEDVGC
jgi:hypothetical protein